MSVYKPKGSPYYHFDFQRRGRRYCGSTECASRREAEQAERVERDRVRALEAAETLSAAFSERDVTRAVKGAEAAGLVVTRVEIAPDGRITLATERSGVRENAG